MRKAVIIAILFCQLVLTGVFAQTNYPIYVTPTLTPPYSLNLSDYSKFGSQKLMVNVTVNDLNISNLPVKLRIKMETAGIVIENPPTINASPIYLDGGSTSILYGKDLLDYFNIKNLVFKGYEKEAYNRTGQLPEGFYKISVQVLHAHTNRLISNTGTTSAWIAVGKPPVLKIPENEADLGQFKGMPITFSWLTSNIGSPVSANNIQYKLEMWEMRVDGIAPEVVAASMPVFHEHTTYNTLYSLYPATLMMEPGMKYAWRVTASDIAGFVSFEQKGQSEIRTFVYKTLCDTVTNFTASHRAKNGMFEWEPQSNHTSYNTEIRNPKTGWVSQSQTFENKAEFFDLEYGTTYELRVQAVCNGDPESTSDFSPWKTLTIPEPKPLIDTASCPDCGCDDMIPNVDLENFELNEDLKPGDIVVNKTGTTRFIIKTVEPQGNGVYKGLFLFWAEVWNLKFICEYWDLQVNKENVIVNMDFESVYDPQFLIDIDATTDYLNNLANSINTLTLDARIKDTLSVNEEITSIYVNGGDSVIAVTVDEKGEIHEVVINNNADDIEKTMIKGKNGEEYVVTKDGQVMGVNEYKQTGGGNARKIKEHKEKQETENLSSTKEVAFKASDKQKFGFDLYNEEKSALDAEYPPLKNGYRPAYKSVASFGTDKVGVSENGDNIIFKDEMGIPALKTGEDLTVRGASGGSEVALYAYQKINDTTEKVVGKLNIFSFDEQAKKVYIVPVNGAKLPQESELKKTLNKVYAQAVTSWEVVPVDNLEDIVFENGKMTHGESSAFSTYNKDQKTIVKAFEDKNGKLEKDACYLFFVEDVQYKGRSIAGYMPLQRQVGFIYDNPGNNIVAHELGHGAFNLYHTFSDKRFLAAEHSTQNLMDYKGGTELWKHQWQLVQSPDKLWFSWAQDEEEGEMSEICLGEQELVDEAALLSPQEEMTLKENMEHFKDYTGIKPYIYIPAKNKQDEELFKPYMKWNNCREKGLIVLINPKEKGNWERNLRLKSNISRPGISGDVIKGGVEIFTREYTGSQDYAKSILNLLDHIRYSFSPKTIEFKIGRKEYNEGEVALFDKDETDRVKIKAYYDDRYITVKKEYFRWNIDKSLEPEVDSEDQNEVYVDLSNLKESQPQVISVNYDGMDNAEIVISKNRVKFARAEEDNVIDNDLYMYDENDYDDWSELGHHIVVPVGRRTYFRLKAYDIALYDFVDESGLVTVNSLRSTVLKEKRNGSKEYLVEMNSNTGQDPGVTKLFVRLKGSDVNVANLNVHVVATEELRNPIIYNIFDRQAGWDEPRAYTTTGNAARIFSKIGYTLTNLTIPNHDVHFDLNDDDRLNYFENHGGRGNNYEINALASGLGIPINNDLFILSVPTRSCIIYKEVNVGDNSICVNHWITKGFYYIVDQVNDRKDVIRVIDSKLKEESMQTVTLEGNGFQTNYGRNDFRMIPKSADLIRKDDWSRTKIFVKGKIPTEHENIWRPKIKFTDDNSVNFQIRAIENYLDKPNEYVINLEQSISENDLKKIKDSWADISLSFYEKTRLNTRISRGSTVFVCQQLKQNGIAPFKEGLLYLSDGETIECVRILGVQDNITISIVGILDPNYSIGNNYACPANDQLKSYVSKGIESKDAPEGVAYTKPAGFAARNSPNVPVFIKDKEGDIELIFVHEFSHAKFDLNDIKGNSHNIMNGTLINPSRRLFKLPFTYKKQELQNTSGTENQWKKLFNEK